MIELNDLNKLKPAAEVKQVAETSEDTIQTRSVAYAINSSANSGEVRVKYEEPLRPNVRTLLEENGYKLTATGNAAKNMTIISWEE